MEENQENARKIAKDENKEIENAVYDNSSGSVIDIDDILLMDDEPVVHKLNNLMKYGVTAEMIKSLYGVTSNLSGGEKLEIALSELENVFFILAEQVTRLPNGIIIDMKTGMIDEEASEIETLILEHGANYVDRDKDIFDLPILADAIAILTENPIKADELLIDAKIKYFENSHEFGIRNSFADLEKNEEAFKEIIDSIVKKHNNPEMEQKIKESIEKNIDKLDLTRVETIEEADFMDYIYKITIMIKNNKDISPEYLRKINELYDQLPDKEKFAQVFDDNGKLSRESIKDFKEAWEHERNEADIYVDLRVYSTIGYTEGMSPDERERFIITLAQAMRHTDNIGMQELAIRVAKDYGLEYSYESINAELAKFKNTPGQTADELIDLHEINDYTYDVKFDRIRSTIYERVGGEIENSQTESVRRVIVHDYKKKTYFALFDTMLEKPLGDSDFRAQVLLKMLSDYYNERKLGDGNKSLKKTTEETILVDYIKKNKAFFDEKITRKMGVNIFDERSNINMERVNFLVEKTILPEQYEVLTEALQDEVSSLKDKIGKMQEKDQEYIKEIKAILKDEENLENIDVAHLLKLVKLVNIENISSRDRHKLMKVSPEIKEELINKMEIADQNLNKAKSLSESLKTESNFSDEEIAYLMELKLEYYRGTPEFDATMRERNALYKNNTGIKEIAESLRDRSGNFKSGKKDEISDFERKFYYKRVEQEIRTTAFENLDEEGKKNYASWLIAGMYSKDFNLQKISSYKLRLLYPELAEMDDPDEFKRNVFSKVTEVHKGDDLEKKALILKDNLRKKIFREVSLGEKKIKDSEMDLLFEEKAVKIDVSAIDLTKTELQNKFNGSRINFSIEDDELFDKTFENASVDSWVGNKKDACLFELVMIKRMENDLIFERDPDEYDRKKEIIEKRTARFEKLLGVDKEIYDKKGNIKSEYLDAADRFYFNKTISGNLKGLTKNVLPLDYHKLNDGEKRVYLKHTLLAISITEGLDNSKIADMYEKLALRALEKMNTDEEKYVTFDENNKATINRELLTKLYKQLNPEKNDVLSFDGVLDEVEQDNLYNYVGEKTKHYTEFIVDLQELEGKDYHEKFKQIEGIKFNEKRKEGYKKAAIEKSKGKSLTLANRNVDGKQYHIRKGEAKICQVYMVDKSFDKGFEKVETTNEEVKESNSRDVIENNQKDNSENNAEIKDTSTLKSEDFNTDAIPNDYEMEVEADKGIKSFFKSLLKRFNTKGLPSGNEETKKQGFFARLFNKKEKNEEVTPPPVVHEDKKVPSGLDHVVLDNSDGKYNYLTSGTNKSQDAGKVSEQKNQDEIGEIS